MNSDVRDLLQSLNDEGVEYLVIGGYAVIRYTEPRYTKDLDILIGRTPDNAKRLMQALRNFGAPLASVTEEDFLEPGIFYQIGVAPNRVDIISSVGNLDFAAAYHRRDCAVVEGIDIPFISLDDLIETKLIAGRPQDLVDASALAKMKAAG